MISSEYASSTHPYKSPLIYPSIQNFEWKEEEKKFSCCHAN